MNVIIIDDEIPALEHLKYQLSKFNNVCIMGAFIDAIEALAFVLKNDVDVVFLDIEMPGLNGVQFAETLLSMKKTPKIVFVTAYNTYAVKAFEVDVVDFILKPVQDDRLLKTIERLERITEVSSEYENSQYGKVKQVPNENSNFKLSFKSNDRIILVYPKDIYYFSSLNGITEVYSESGRFQSNESLSYFEELLVPHRFYRCHRCFLIRLDLVEALEPAIHYNYVLKLKACKNPIPVSRRKTKELKAVLNIR